MKTDAKLTAVRQAHRFDENAHKQLIIERIFCYGTISELKDLFSYFGSEEIKRNKRR